jgi:ligand-binding sensor domain-containing protein
MSKLSKARWGIVGAGLFLAVFAAALFAWRVSTALRASRQEVTAQNSIEFVTRPYLSPANTRFEPVSAPAEFVQAAKFQGYLYIAGPGGLLEYAPDGTLVKQFSVGRDLPSSPLVGLTVAIPADAREPELILASAKDGLLTYDGRSFRQIYPKEASARAITCVADSGSGHVLIGTKERGVLVFDGKKIQILHPTLGDVHVTALAGTEDDLWVGTLDRGVLHWHGGTTERFDEAQGLPDHQVLSIAVAGEKTYIGTVVGAAVFDGGRFSHVIANGVFATALQVDRNDLEIGTQGEGVLTVPLEGQKRTTRGGGRSAVSEIRQFLAWDDAQYVLARTALYRMNPNGLGWQQVLKPNPATLSDSNISALAGDSEGQLWVGYFDRGLDVMRLESNRVRHVEDERVFCVNRILPEAKTGTIDVATANGLVRFAVSGSEEQILTRMDGLIADHVTDVVPYGGGLALATPAGLTFLDSGGARSLYAFHGLVNNHVYALGVAGDKLLVGTLGGISMIGHEAVQANYTASNSGLKHNWITAAVPVEGGWMIGTYGAGILGMDRSGHFHSYDGATADFDVNPNAMLVTRQYVLAGSLGRGLYVYEIQTGRWTQITEGLPSLNVTALARVGRAIYVGTDNGLVRVEEQNLQP